MIKGLFARILLPKPFEEACSIISASGYSAIHMNLACIGTLPMPPRVSPEQIQLIKLTAEKYKLEIVGLSGTFNIIHPDISYRSEYFDRFKVLKQLAIELDIPLISLCTGTRNPDHKWTTHPDNNSVEAWRDMTYSVEKLIKIVDGTDLALGIEPEVGNVVNTCSKAAQLIKELATDQAKIIFDPANLFEKSTPQEVRYLIESGLDMLGHNLAMVHIKDRDADGKFTKPGKGIIPFDFLLNQVLSYNSNLPIIAHGFESSDVGKVSRFMDRIIP